MGAHRYWRLMLRATNGGPNGGVGELQMRATLGGVNVATGGIASASSVYGGTTFPAAKAFDGLTTDTGAINGWAAAAFAGAGGLGSFPWLKYDFGAGNAKDIAEIVIFAPGAGGLGANELPAAWAFQYSDDDVTWVTQRSYAFDLSTPNWVLNTSRIYDVRPLGALDVRNQVLLGEIARRDSPPVGSPSRPTTIGDAPELDSLKSYWDLTHGGSCKLAGSTTSLGNPVARRVRLYHQEDGQLYGEQYTAEDGLFEFRNIEQGPWTVVGVDDTGTQNAVIYSHVNAVPM